MTFLHGMPDQSDKDRPCPVFIGPHAFSLKVRFSPSVENARMGEIKVWNVRILAQTNGSMRLAMVDFPKPAAKTERPAKRKKPVLRRALPYPLTMRGDQGPRVSKPFLYLTGYIR